MIRSVLPSGLLLLALSLSIPFSSHAADIDLEFLLPASMFYPGDAFWLDLGMTNQGPALPAAQLFVLMEITSGQYWCYPSWVMYPPGLDWLDLAIPTGMAGTRSILPSFTWPDAGEFTGARFWGAVLAEGELVSNVAMAEFGWGREPPPEGWSAVGGGAFLMGSPESDECRYTDEAQHPVTLTRSFLIMETEVTQAGWLALFPTNPSVFEGDGRPVQNVTWFDACAYCNRLSVSESHTPSYYSDAAFSMVFDGTPPIEEGEVYWNPAAGGYRLPTEAEWEFACRAGTTSAYHNGTDPLSCTEEDANLNPIAWYNEVCVEPQVVGSKEPNAFGLHDMAGNVQEWCWDRYSFAYPPGSATDPTGPEIGSQRVRRGGSWYFPARHCRSAGRTGNLPDYSQYTTGFRVARSY